MDWKNRIVNHATVSPAELITLANPKNPRLHPEFQTEAVEGSLREIGWIQDVIINTTTGRMLDGHLRVKLALASGQPGVPVKYVELTEAEEALALATLDYTTNLAEFDEDIMTALLSNLDANEAGLKSLLQEMRHEFGIDEPADDGEIVEDEPPIDRADELMAKWGTEPGQLWQLGDHRLICGDCTDPAVVNRLMAGKIAQICWTDPPWNVAYGSSNHPSWKQRSIENDNLGDDFPEFAANFTRAIFNSVAPGGMIYMAMSAQEWPVIDKALREAGFHWSSTIIWVKDSLVLSRKDYHTQYEPLWYGWRGDAARLVELEDRTQSDVWQIPRPKRSDEHPTMKPVELVGRSLKNSSRPRDLVFDPFAGSGPTIVAGEQTGRQVYAIELMPQYVAVCLERWHVFTDQTPVLLNIHEGE